jgi:hypothetical protein
MAMRPATLPCANGMVRPCSCPASDSLQGSGDAVDNRYGRQPCQDVAAVGPFVGLCWRGDYLWRRVEVVP